MRTLQPNLPPLIPALLFISDPMPQFSLDLLSHKSLIAGEKCEFLQRVPNNGQSPKNRNLMHFDTKLRTCFDAKPVLLAEIPSVTIADRF
jgi:hypothetical protein